MNKALGLIETIGLVCAIEAADAAVKAANVTLLGYENARGGGKITVKLVGDVGAVKAAVTAGVAAAQRIGKVYSHSVIPRPHGEITALIEKVEHSQVKEPAAPLPEPAPVLPVVTIPEVQETVPPLPVVEAPEAQETGSNGSGEERHLCAAITHSGEPCKLRARPGSNYCSVHRKLETAG